MAKGRERAEEATLRKRKRKSMGQVTGGWADWQTDTRRLQDNKDMLIPDELKKKHNQSNVNLWLDELMDGREHKGRSLKYWRDK